MLLLRLLFLIFLAYVVYLVLRAYAFPRNTGKRFAESDKADDMVLDPQCHTYVPKKEAVSQNGNYFCSRECARLFLSR